MRTSARIILFTSLIGIPLAGFAQPFPSKPIRLIVPFSTGGSADTLARTTQTPLSEVLGQPIVIDNRGGASGTIGTDLAAKAQPDGHTILLVTTTYTVIPSLMKKLPYDPRKDLAPVSLVVSQPNILAVHPSVPAKTVKELVALAKAKPNTLNFAGGGNGSSPHLSGELLKIVAGVQITHVPYKGSGPAVTDLIGGHVHMMFAGPLAFEQHIKAGRLRALAVAANKRSPILPQVPTMAEAGYPGIETGTWFAILAPANTPKAVINTLHQAVFKVVHDPNLASRFAKLGVDVVGSGPAELGRHMEAEMTKWAKLVRQAGITLD
ncbi:MAG: hypothetical protein A3G24_23940 [Betaproteobacteria bacterium RIFCSPLOWO2_12_FULL_62_13]|nr:MAG: hypothetical protein A3G24_23940 [Betaproteobacteria bacterium RIFCSPLOWO2_12_FULL_62_13]